MAGQVLSPAIQVDVEDRYDNLVTTSTAPVTLTANGPAGFASGTEAANVTGGIATFSNLMLLTAGSYTLTAADTNVADGLKPATTQAFAVNASLTASITDAVTVLQNQSSGSIALASFGEVGASSNPGDYTATVNWGDNTSSSSIGSNPAVIISIAGVQVTVSGSHTFATAGLTYPTVTLTYPGVSASTASQAITIDVAADVTGQIKASASPYHGNPFTKLTTNALTLTNSGTSGLAGQFSVVLHGLISTAALQSAALVTASTSTPLSPGKTSAGDPMIEIPNSLLSALGGNQAVQISLSFSNPANGAITYTPMVYSDPAAASNNQGTTTVPHTGNTLTVGGVQFTFGQGSSLTSMVLGGVTFTSTTLQIAYTPPAGGATDGTYRVYGTAIMSGVSGLSNPTVQFGTDASSAGLVIANNSLKSFAATISGAGFTVPGGSLAPSSSLELSYPSTGGETFTITGGATLTAGPLALGLDLGGATTAGLVITAGSIHQIAATLSGSFALGGFSFSTSGLTVAYSSANNGTYTISGDTTMTDTSSSGGPLLDIDLGGLVGGVATAGLVLSDGSVTALVASMSGTFTIGRVSLDASGLEIAYSPANNGTYTLSGDSSLSATDSTTIPIQLGGTVNGQSVPGLQIEDGTPQDFNASVTNSLQVGVLAIAAQADSLTVAYTTSDETYNVTGTASLSVSPTTSIAMQLGGIQNGQTEPGLTIASGAIKDFSASVNGSFDVGGVSIVADSLTLAYTVIGDTYNIIGSASLSVSAETSISIQLGGTAGGPQVPGLLIESGALKSFTASVNGVFGLGGTTIQANDLTVAYTAGTTETYDITGGATLSIAQTTDIMIGLGGTVNGTTYPALEIASGTVMPFDAPVTAAFNMLGLTLGSSGLTVAYVAPSATDSHSLFNLYGNPITLSTENASISGLQADLGDSANPGVEFQDGALESLNFGITGTIDLGPTSLTATSLTLGYVTPDGPLQITGGANLSLSSTISGTVTVPAGELTIDTSTGDIETNWLGFTLPGPFAFDNGTLGVSNLNVTYTSSAGVTSAAATGTVELPLGLDVSGGFIYTGSTLTEIALSYSGDPIPLGSSGLLIASLQGAIINPDDPSTIAVSGSINMTFGENIEFQGQEYSLFTETGTFTESLNAYSFAGDVSFINGIIGTGTFTESEIDTGLLTDSFSMTFNCQAFAGLGSIDGSLDFSDTTGFIVSGIATLDLGNLPVTDVPLIGVSGTLTINSSELSISHSTVALGGLLNLQSPSDAPSTDSLALDWKTGMYSVSFDDSDSKDGQQFQDLNGTLSIDIHGHTTGTATYTLGAIGSNGDVNVTGNLFIDSQELTLTGNGTGTMGGVNVGSGNIDVSLDWAGGSYLVNYDINLVGGLGVLDGNMTVDSQTDTASGNASVTLGPVGSTNVIDVSGAFTYDSQEFTLDGEGSMFGMDLGSVDVSLNWAAGQYSIATDFSDDGFNVNGSLSVTTGSNWTFGGSLSFGCELDAEIGPIEVPKTGINLGSLHLDTGFTGTVSVNASAQSSSISLGLGGSFNFEGATLSVPTFTVTVNVPFASISSLAGQVVDEIKSDAYSIFSGELSTVGAWISDIKSGVLTGISDIGNALENVYHVVAADVVGFAQDAGQGLAAAARILANDYNQTAAEVASTLKNAGAAATEVAGALETALEQSASEIIGALHTAGYAIDDVAAALQSGLNLGVREAAQLLQQSALYVVSDVGNALQTIYNIIDPAALDTILGEAGFSVSSIESYFENLGGDFQNPANALENSEFNPSSW